MKKQQGSDVLGEKDMTQKTLEAFNDVFADIVNGLLFQGEQVISETSRGERIVLYTIP